MITGCKNNNSVANIAAGVVSIAGVAADGPIAGGTVTVTDATGTVVATGTTNNDGTYNVNVPRTALIPLDITISGGTDTITNKPQDFPVSTAVTTPVASITQVNANANAFTTVIVAAAKAEAASKGIALDTATLASATTKVVGNMGFGLDPAIDPINTTMTAANTADMIKANEALSELIRRTTTDKVSSDNAATASAGLATGTATTVKVASLADIQSVIATMAADVSDGVLDGNTSSQAVLDAATKAMNDSYANASAGEATVAAVTAGKSVAQAALDAGVAKQQAIQQAITPPTPVEAQATVTLAQVNTVQVVTEVLTNSLQITDTKGLVVADAATTQVNMDRYAAASVGLTAGSTASNAISTANVDASKSNLFLKKQIAVAVATAKAVVVNNDTYSASSNIQTSANQTAQLNTMQASVLTLIDASVQKATAITQATQAGQTTQQVALIAAQEQATIDAYSATLTTQRDSYANTITATKIDAVTTVSVQVAAVKVTQQIATQTAQGAAAKTTAQVQAAKDTAQQNAVVQVATVAAKDIYTQQVVQQQTQQDVAVQVQQVTQQRQQGTSLAIVDTYAQTAQQTATTTATTATAQTTTAAATVSNVNVNTQNTTAINQVVQTSNTNTQTATDQANATALANSQATPPQFITWNWTNKVQEQGRYHINDVVWNGTVFVAVADKGVIRSSVDGYTWALRPSGTSENLTSVVANPTTGTMVATGTNGALLSSADGITWTVKQLNVFGDFLFSHWSGTLFYIGERTGTLFSSVDGQAWTVVNNNVAGNAFAMTSNNAGQLVILRDRNMISTSADTGATWTTQAMPVPGATSLTWAAGLAKYVAVGDRGVVATSLDAYTWTLQVSGLSQGLNSVKWTGNALVASGSYGTLITSFDGVNWTGGASTTAVSIRATATNGIAQVAVGDYGTILSNNVVANTLNIVQSSASNRLAFTDMLWNGTRFVGVGFGGTIQTSLDGYTWTKAVSGTTANLNDLSWNGTRFIAVGSRGTVLQSVDGVAWNVINTAIAPSIPVISNVTGTIQTVQQLRLPDLFAVDQRGGLIVAVGEAGTIISSTDGVNWAAQNSGLTAVIPVGNSMRKPHLRTITLGTNLMLATSAEINVEVVSADAITWAPATSPVEFSSVTSSGLVFVATSIRRGGGLYHSTDAYTWIAVTGSTASSNNRTLSWDGAKFVAFGTGLRTSLDAVTWTWLNSTESLNHVANNGQYWLALSGDTALTSSNALTWTTTNSQDPASVSDVASNGTRMVAVGRSVDGNAAIRVSTDNGLTWSNLTGLPRTAPLNRVVWSGTRFVAIGSNQILSSADGQTLQVQASAMNESFSDLVWTGSQFVIVVNASIQTSTDSITWAQHLVVTTPANPLQTANRLTAIAVSPTTWVLAATGSDNSTSNGWENSYTIFYTSTNNGLTWVAGSRFVEAADKTNNFNTPIYVNQMLWTGAQFVASSSLGILHSTDGLSWSLISGVWTSSLATDGYSIVATPAGSISSTQRETRAWVSTDGGNTWLQQNEFLPIQASQVSYDTSLAKFIAINRSGQTALSAASQPATLLVPVAKSAAASLAAWSLVPSASRGNYAIPNPTLMTISTQSVNVQDYYASGTPKALQTATASVGANGGLVVNLPALNASNVADLVAGKATAVTPTIQVPFSALPDVSGGRIKVQAIVKDGTGIARVANERWLGIEYSMDWSMTTAGGFKLSPVGDATLSYSLSTNTLGIVAKIIIPSKDTNVMTWDSATNTMNMAIASNMFAIKSNGTSLGSLITAGGNYFYQIQVSADASAPQILSYMPPFADSNSATFTRVEGTFTVR